MEERNEIHPRVRAYKPSRNTTVAHMRVHYTVCPGIVLLFFSHLWWVRWGRNPTLEGMIWSGLLTPPWEKPNSWVEHVLTVDELEEVTRLDTVLAGEVVYSGASVESSACRFFIPGLFHFCWEPTITIGDGKR